MKGKDRATVEAELRAAGKSEQEISSIAPHKVGQHLCTLEQLPDVESYEKLIFYFLRSSSVIRFNQYMQD